MQPTYFVLNHLDDGRFEVEAALSPCLAFQCLEVAEERCGLGIVLQRDECRPIEPHVFEGDPQDFFHRVELARRNRIVGFLRRSGEQRSKLSELFLLGMTDPVKQAARQG